MDKLLRDAKKMLGASGVPHEIVEASGGKQHHEIFIQGERALVLSKGPARGRDLRALTSAIHRGLAHDTL